MKTSSGYVPRPTLTALLIAIGLIGPIASIEARATIKETRNYTNQGQSYVLVCTDEASGKPVDCREPSVKYSKGSYPLETALSRNDFAGLDAMFDRVSSGEERFSDGAPVLATLQEILFKLHSVWGRWDQDLAKIKEWQRVRPASIGAKFAEAIYWHSFAWNARGGGYASEVTKDGRDLFQQRLAKASALVEELRPHGKRIPGWYVLKMHVAISSGNMAEARAAFDEGIALHRMYYPLYIAAARTYEPKWGGSVGQFESFANKAVKLAKGHEGRGIYARIYWSVDSTHDMPFRSVKQSAPDWKKLNAGFSDLLKLYPKSHNILNQYASVACRSNDSALYRQLRTRLGDYLDETDFKIDTVDVCDVRHKWQPPR